MNSIRSLILMLSRIPPALLLALIVGTAGLTTLLVTGEVERNRANYEQQKLDLEAKAKATGTVVIALKDVPEGATVSSDMLEEKKIPVGNIPTDALANGAMAAGRITKYGITAGQIVSQHDLAPIGISLDFEARLKPGMRAITFGVDTNSGVAGFINPESRVDIMSMVGTGGDTKVAPILSDVEVIAVGQMYQKQPGSQAVPANSVTVAINPEDAQKLVKAVAASKIYLSMRSQGDHQPVVTVDVTSLYPKKPNEDGTQIADAAALIGPPPAALQLPSPPNMNEPSFNPGDPQASAGAMRKPNHEIEMWNGGNKQVVELQNNI